MVVATGAAAGVVVVTAEVGTAMGVLLTVDEGAGDGIPGCVDGDAGSDGPEANPSKACMTNDRN